MGGRFPEERGPPGPTAGGELNRIRSEKKTLHCQFIRNCRGRSFHQNIKGRIQLMVLPEQVRRKQNCHPPSWIAALTHTVIPLIHGGCVPRPPVDA